MAQGSAPSRKEGGQTLPGLNAFPQDITDTASLYCSKMKVQKGIIFYSLSLGFGLYLKNKWLINTSHWFYF